MAVSLLTPEIISGVLVIIGAATTGIFGFLRWTRHYVDRTTNILRTSLADTRTALSKSDEKLDEAKDQRHEIDKMLQAEILRSDRLEQEMQNIKQELARVEGRAEEREIAILRMSDQLRKAHEDNGKLIKAKEDITEQLKEERINHADAKTFNEKLKDVARGKESVIAAQRGEIDEVVEAKAKMKRELKQVNTTLSKADTELKKSKMQIKTLEGGSAID